MTDKTAIWDKLARVPKEHLKPFTRAGGFKGTAIKPMWTIHRMTEEFGPCGEGWGVNEPIFQVVPGHNGEVLVYCTVSIWHGDKSKFVYGVGGDRIVSYIKPNEQYHRPERWDNDDEAFKKAFTDAVTNALKMIGAGADIHMGLWDGNKYVDEKPKGNGQDADISTPIDRPEDSDFAGVSGNPGISASKVAKEFYEQCSKEIRTHRTAPGLKKWGETRKPEIQLKLTPGWVGHLEQEYLEQMHDIKSGKFA